MEFMNRGNRPNQTPASPVSSSSTTASNGGSSRNKGIGSLVSLKVASIVLLFSVTVLAAAVLFIVALGKPASEANHVDSSKMQAVFLNGGQVYFGRVHDLNSNFMRLRDIYYLRVNQQVQPGQEDQQASANDISLVKLGCELHGPDDEMLINREQIVFWENLKDDGQVAKAVDEYKTQNPNGQNCSTDQQQSQTPATTPAATEEDTDE